MNAKNPKGYEGIQWWGGNKAPSTETSGTGSSGYGGYGSGGGSGPTDQDKKAFDNLGALTGFNFETPKRKYEQGAKTFEGNKTFLGDQLQNRLDQASQQAGNEWYKTQQDLQSVSRQLLDASGNAVNGSFYNDFLDVVARKDDQSDVAILNNLRDNKNDIFGDYYEALQSDVNNQNELAMDVESALRDVAADWFAQGNNLHYDLVKQYADTAGHTLKLPDWLDTAFFDSHYKEPIDYQSIDLFRPENAADQATMDTIEKPSHKLHTSAGSKDYWTRMREGYDRRGQ